MNSRRTKTDAALVRAPAAKGGEARPGIFKTRHTRWLLALCVIQFFLLVVLSFLWNGNQSSLSKQAPPRSYSISNREPLFFGQPGPWGELEYVRINIEPPDEFMPEDILNLEKARWFFPEFTTEQLVSFFQNCGLTDTDRAELLNTAAWGVESNGIAIVPSSRLVTELNPSARTRIYATLARSERNEFHFWPYTYRNGGFEDWFDDSELSPATLALLRQMVYSRGPALCFSDMAELVPRIPTATERRRLIKTLFRNSTLLMKLRVRPGTDVKALAEYWGGDRRAKDIAPLLDSLTKVDGGITIDVAHLLPAFARKRLYTYPITELLTGQPMPDCYWTAMNFFNDPPDNRYHNETEWSRELEADFYPVHTPVCGDVIFLLRHDNVPIHAAVYVADNTVFSKNGGHYRQPWVLMKMEDLLARYPEDYAIRTITFRRKPADH